MTRPILYHIYPSFYSQVARLALVEKGAAWDSAITIAGPPFYDNYKPEYVRMNPNAVVPTLRHGDTVVYESLRIIRYVDANFDGPRLTPDNDADKAEMDRWVDRLDEIPVRILSYGSMKGNAYVIAMKMNDKRIAVLQQLRDKHPDLHDVYEAKIRDISDFSNAAATPDEVTALQAKVNAYLDEFEALVQNRSFLAGNTYSLADVVWSVMVGRMIMLKLEPFTSRPHVNAWYSRMKARPSFHEAEVWEAFQPASMLRSMGERVFGKKPVA